MFHQIFLSSLLVISSLSGVTAASLSLLTNGNVCDGCCEGDSPYVTCNDNEREISGLKETYTFEASDEIDSLKWEGDIKVSHYEIKHNNEINVTIGDFIDHGDITFHFYYQKEYMCSYALYFASDQEGTFYSSGRTLDCAKSLAGQDLGYIFLANEEEPEENLEKESQKKRTSGSVYGYFKWTDDDGVIHPLVGVKVKLTIRGSFRSTSTYTDDNGYYSFQYNNII